eukprot:TRINITY_DN2472_c0_g1_i2.p1 TRINITY_DN2472_c0_g1~~TRINITY_DN2472_c0_g1_i2.p1  ORF type:complete len:532 (-),score=66.76 TRINITY_DN2472_c0_g1_i2:73-1635(-)
MEGTGTPIEDEQQPQPETVFTVSQLQNPEIASSEIQLGKFLGEGSFGQVYLANCRGTQVAVKVLIEQSLSASQVASLQNEISLMMLNRHQNLVDFMGACTEPGKFMFVMQKLDGNLEDLVLDRQTSLFQRMWLAYQTAEGMNWLAHNGVVHRDLKLENIMYKRTGTHMEAKIVDFGLGVVKAKGQHYVDAKVKGTPLTRAPEICHDGKDKTKLGTKYNEKVDVYSYGICLWQLYTQEADPYPEIEEVDELYRVVANGARPIMPADCPLKLRALIEECWSEKPDARPTFRQVMQRFPEILAEATIRDSDAQAFWRTNFRNIETMKPEVPATKFLSLFWRNQQRTVLPNEHGAATTNPNLLKMRAFNLLSAGQKEINMEWFGLLVDWFGPFCPVGDQTMFDRMLELCDLPYFHGSIRREDAASRVGTTPGNYLLRFASTTPGGYTLNRVKPDGSVVSVAIYRHGSEYSTKKNASENPKYASLPDLVDAHYSSLGLQNPCVGPLASQLGRTRTDSVYEVPQSD